MNSNILENYERPLSKPENVELKVRQLNQNLDNLKKICSEFESYNMVGAGIEKLHDDFKLSLKSYEDTLNDYKKYQEILQIREELLEIDKQIEDIEKSIRSYQCMSAETKKEQNYIENEIGKLTKEKNKLIIERQIFKERILQLFSELGLETPPEIQMVTTYTWDDIKDLVNAFSSITKTGNIFKGLVNNGLYSSEEEALEALEDKLSNIRKNYTGQEKTYYSSIEIIETCLAAGLRIPYVHAGTTASGKTENTRKPVPVKTLRTGIDCNALASLLLYGDDSYSSWLAVNQFNEAGEEIDKAESLPGDFFSTPGHVGIVIANNPDTSEMAILHASGQDGDLKFEIVTYDSYLDGKEIRRIDSDYKTDYMQKKYEEELNNEEEIDMP